MKKVHFIIFALIWIFFSGCEKTTYEYIEVDSVFAFNQNDSIIYTGASEIDTFMVSYVIKSMLNTDKNNNIETLDINLKDLSFDCQGVDYNYCGGMTIRRQGNSFTSIEFRNIDYILNNTNTQIITYSFLSGKNLDNVIKIVFENPIQFNNRDISTLYYTNKYGIIAYALINNILFEIDDCIIY